MLNYTRLNLLKAFIFLLCLPHVAGAMTITVDKHLEFKDHKRTVLQEDGIVAGINDFLGTKYSLENDLPSNLLLLKACEEGAVSEATKLLDTGADCDAPYKVGFFSIETPLTIAARFGHADIVSLLMSRGATPNMRVILLRSIWGLHSSILEWALEKNIPILEILDNVDPVGELVTFYLHLVKKFQKKNFDPALLKEEFLVCLGVLEGMGAKNDAYVKAVAENKL